MLNSYDIIISGMGPGGLATAYEALQAGKRVLIVSDRTPDFTRVQNVFIDYASRNYLRNMLPIHLNTQLPEHAEDKKFLNLLDNHLAIGIKDIERYIYRRAIELNNDNHLHMIFEKELKHISMDKGIANIGSINTTECDAITASFTYLIGADGNNHHALNVLKSDEPLLKEEVPIIEVTKDIHKYHVSAYLTLSRKDGKKLNLPEKFALASVYNEHLYGIRFQREEYDTQEQQSGNTKPLKFMFICELPKAIYATKQTGKDEIYKYILEILNQAFAEQKLDNGELQIELVKNSKKYGEKKDKLKLLPFTTNPIQKQLASYSNQGKHFIQVGDALISSDYRFGSGLIFSLFSAGKLGKIFQDKITIKAYTRSCNDYFELLQNSAIYFFSQKNYANKLAKTLDENAEEEQKFLQRNRHR